MFTHTLWIENYSKHYKPHRALDKFSEQISATAMPHTQYKKKTGWFTRKHKYINAGPDAMPLRAQEPKQT